MQLKEELSKSSTNMDSETYVDTLQNIDESVERIASGKGVPATINTLLRGIDLVEDVLDAQNLNARRTRQRLITARTHAWQWLDITLPKMAAQLSGKRTSPRAWLVRLVAQLRHVFQTKAPTCTFHPPQYLFSGSGDDSDTSTAVFVNKKAKRLLAGEEMERAIAEAVPEVVAQWLNYPRDQNRKLAWFVSTLKERLGEEVITMDYVWRMIRHFKSTYVVSGSRPYAIQSASALSEFHDEVARHPISTEGTLESRLYGQYRQLFQGTLDPGDVDVAGRAGPCWARYAYMWKTAREYVQNPHTPSDDKFRKLLQQDPGYYLPIRDKAPDRLKSIGSSGPYTQDEIRTTRGIFSALVWRGVTHRSEFFDDHRILFDDWDDFDDLVQSILDSPDIAVASREDEYFCSNRPYGQVNKDRSIDQVKVYWTSITQRRWEEFLSGHSPLAFSAMLQYFRPRKDAQKVFPNLGKTGSFALVEDLALAGVCELPTVMEIAENILSLGSGGLYGLKDLGLIKGDLKALKRSDRISLIAGALEEVNSFCTNTFSGEDREEMGLNMVVLEHSLCTFHRALVKKALIQ